MAPLLILAASLFTPSKAAFHCPATSQPVGRIYRTLSAARRSSRLRRCLQRITLVLQEGPALCLKKLSADLEGLQQLPHELTSGDLAAYVSAQAAAAERKTNRKRPTP